MGANFSIIKKCEFCKNEFTAKKFGTRYCSHKCNSRHYKELEKQKRLGLIEKASKFNISNIEELNSKEYLTAKQAAIILNMSLRTLYRLIENKELNSYNFGIRKTLIRRKDIDSFFDLNQKENNLEKETYVPKITPENSYTINEIETKYNIHNVTLNRILDKLKIHKKKFGKFVLVRKEDIHSIFESHD